MEIETRNMEPGSIREKLANGACTALKIWSVVSDKTPALSFAAAAKCFVDHAAHLRLSCDRTIISNQGHTTKAVKCGGGMVEIAKKHRL